MSNFFQRLFIGTGDSFANIELDARLVERFDVSTNITDHPVDTGGVVSDHAYLNPESYVIEGVVSDTPLSFVASVQQIGDNIANLTNNISSQQAGADQPAPASKRSVAAFLSLVEFWRNLTVFNVQTAMGLKENLMIQNLTAQVDNNTANMLRFTATLRQVPRVSTSLVLLDDLKTGPVQESAGAVNTEGVKQAEPSTPDLIASVTRSFE